MTTDQIDYMLGLRSRPMTDAERLIHDARRVVDAYRTDADPEIPGLRCVRR